MFPKVWYGIDKIEEVRHRKVDRLSAISRQPMHWRVAPISCMPSALLCKLFPPKGMHPQISVLGCPVTFVMFQKIVSVK